MDAARGSHTRWQEGHVLVLSVRGAIVANLFSSVCVCLLLQDLVQSCLCGEGGILEDMCYESPGLTAGALGPSIVSLNTNKSSSSSSSSSRRRAEACVD